MSSFLLKIIAVITMFCDHYGDVIARNYMPWNLIGRIAFPIFAFQIAQGYIHTSNLKKYALRLLIFACISQFPFMLFLRIFVDEFALNVFFTMFLGFLAIFAYDKIDNKFLGFIVSAIIAVIAHFIKVDYGAYGVAIIFLFYIYSRLCNSEDATTKRKIAYMFLMCTTFICATIINFIDDIINSPSLVIIYVQFIACTCISLIPICLYNGKQGPKLKYLFYIFYPLHLLVLWFVNTNFIA